MYDTFRSTTVRFSPQWDLSNVQLQVHTKCTNWTVQLPLKNDELDRKGYIVQ